MASNPVPVCPKVGDVVTVSCRLVPVESFVPEPLIDGVVLSEGGDPQTLTFVLGRGNYLPGLHELVLTLRESESATGVPMDAGWGSRNPDLIAKVSFDSLRGLDRSKIQMGTQLQLANGVACTVTEVTNESFTIDANPPLAGATYRADVTLLKVEPGPKLTAFSERDEEDDDATSRYHVATFALGCFWGGELEFMREPGVVGTEVGYTQGSLPNPTYEQVCSGVTGHTEAIAVTYDLQAVSYERLVHLAMDRLGDNKYLKNQVGNDRGTQYRHGVYYHTPQQQLIAESIVRSFGSDCQTECLPAQMFYPAEEYHQQYLLKKGQSARKGDTSVIRCYG